MSNENEQKAVEANTNARLNEIKNVNRIVSNAINLINDVDIKGAHAQPVTEILGWLIGFSQSLTAQMKTLESTLPKKEEDKKPELKVEKAVDNQPKAAVAETKAK